MQIRRVQPGVVWVIGDDNRVVSRTIDDLATWLDVNPATVRRWANGARMPVAVDYSLRFLLGELHHPAWKRFRVNEKDGKLRAGNGYEFQPAELEHFQVIFQTNRALWNRRSAPTSSQSESESAAPPKQNVP